MKSSIILLALLSTASVHAEDTSGGGPDANRSTVKAPAAATESGRKDIDQEITNNKLRAETGSKSLISMQSSFNYNGGSVNEAFSKNRPKLSAGTVASEPAKLTGNISAKYRLTDHDNLNAGVGVGWVTPSYEGQKGQMENPYLSYGRVFKTGSVQNVFSATVQKYTADIPVRLGKYNYETSLSHTVLTTIPGTKLEVGVAVAWDREIYSQYIADNVIDILAAYPFAEYALTDAVSLRTVFRGTTFYSSAERRDVFTRDEPTQSFGVGVAIMRDVYLYPNIQWVWEDMKAEKTNVALAANINL